VKEYEKIETVFERDIEGSRRLIPGAFRNPAVAFLSNCDWEWTEKIDGTNIRVHWDGFSVEFGGRTDRANIPTPLLDRLGELFCGSVSEDLFEQMFGGKDVILFGEGFGKKIQAVGSQYIPDGVDFILFDVCINGTYLDRSAVDEIAKAFGIRSVPVVKVCGIDEAIKFLKDEPVSTIGKAPMGGLVGRPVVELYDKRGRRVIVKLKERDFREISV
jgi:hypothetical protein